MAKSSRLVLAENLKALLVDRYGSVNKTRFAAESKISVGTVLRLISGETSIGLDVVDQIATFFRIPAYDLLVPNINPKSPPELISKKELDAARIATEALRKIATGQ